MGQPGARPVQGEPAGRRKGCYGGRPGQCRRQEAADRKLRISDAADGADRAARLGARVMEIRRKEAEALRERVQTCEEANAYFKSMQNAAIREPVTKTSADLPARFATCWTRRRSAISPRRKSRSRAWKWSPFADASRPPSIRRKSARCAKRCSPKKFEKKSKALSGRNAQSRDDRISLTHGKASRADIRRTCGHRPRYRHRSVAAAQRTEPSAVLSARRPRVLRGAQRKSWDCKSSLPMPAPKKRGARIRQSLARGGDGRNRHGAARASPTTPARPPRWPPFARPSTM